MSSEDRKNIPNRLVKALLSFSVVLSLLLLPQTAQTAYADSPAALSPTVATYQDGSDANAYTEYSKVYFGSQSLSAHRWYIAGKESETNSLVLLCDPATDYGISPYFADSEDYTVDSYNSSALDNAIQDLVSKRYFTSAEQSLMKEVSINCPVDKAHPTGYYETLNRKLYAASAYYNSNTEYRSDSILAGSGDGTIEMRVSDDRTSGAGDVDAGAGYVANVGEFWLRSCYFEDIDGHNAAMMSFVREGSRDDSVGPRDTSTEASVVPVTQLDLSCILFASSAAPATTGSTFDTSAMTIRCDSAMFTSGGSVNSDRISAGVTVNTNGITLTKGTDSDEYLYVQWNDGTADKVFSIKIDSDMAIAASCIGVSDLTDCRIWVERKDTTDDLVYAKRFTDISGTGSYSHINNGGICTICGAATHTHNWRYSAEGSRLETYCGNTDCPSGTDENNKIALTLSADPAASGNAAVIHIGTDDERTVWQTAGLTLPETLSYEKADGTALTEAPTTAGNYIAEVSPDGETPTSDNTAGVAFSISRLEPSAVAPTANKLTYTGSEQALVSEGSTADGSLRYSLSKDGTYSIDIPTACKAGKYSVYYKVVGDSEHNDKVFETPVSVNIARAVYSGIKEASGKVSAGLASTGEIKLPEIPENMSAGIPETSAGEITDLSVRNGKLIFKGKSSVTDGTVYVLTIPVLGGTGADYENYEITVTLTGETCIHKKTENHVESSEAESTGTAASAEKEYIGETCRMAGDVNVSIGKDIPTAEITPGNNAAASDDPRVKDDPPATGDAAGTGLWICLMIASATVFTAMAKMLKKCSEIKRR